MELLQLLNGLGPFAQLVLTVGCFATIFLVAFNRTAADNLTLFLHNLHKIWFQRHITIELIQKHHSPLHVDDDLRPIICNEKEREGIIEEQALPEMKP